MEEKTFYVRRPITLDFIIEVKAENAQQALDMASMTETYMTHPTPTKEEVIVWVDECQDVSYKKVFGENNMKVLWSEWISPQDISWRGKKDDYCVIDHDFVDESEPEETEEEKAEREVCEIVDILLKSGWKKH